MQVSASRRRESGTDGGRLLKKLRLQARRLYRSKKFSSPGSRELEGWNRTRVTRGEEFWREFPSNLSKEINPQFNGEALKELAAGGETEG